MRVLDVDEGNMICCVKWVITDHDHSCQLSKTNKIYGLDGKAVGEIDMMDSKRGSISRISTSSSIYLYLYL
jgi:hypothetical protein